MNKVLQVFMALVLTVGICLPAFAQENVATTVSTVTTTVVSGEIVSVDTTVGSIVVKQVKDAAAGTSDNYTVEVTKDSKIIKAEVLLKVNDLKAGDKVTVNAKAEGKTLKAETITVG